MRCPDCAKFVSYDDPQTIDIQDYRLGDDDDPPSGEFTVSLTCAECGTELKQAEVAMEFPNFDPEYWAVELGKHDGSKHQIELDIDEFDADTTYEGKGRYAKTFYGATGVLDVRCSCGGTFNGLPFHGYVQASDMDEQV
jgi:hypothetical protein